MRKYIPVLCRKLHAWGGFLLSILMLLISLTGTLLVWKKEYLLLTEPEARSAAETTPEIAARVSESAMAMFGGENILLIQFESENTALNKVFLSGSEYAYLDQSGDLVDRWHLNGRFEEWLYDLHHRLLMGDTGLLISGWAAVILIGLIVPGLIAWWPTRKGFQWRVFVSGLFKYGLLRPQVLATHRNLGVLSALPILVILVTAVVLSFPNQAQRVLVDPYSSTDGYSDLFVENLDAISGAENGQLEPSFARAQALMDGARIRSIQLPYGYSAYNLIGLQREGEWHSSGLNLVYIDPDTGYMDMSLSASRLPAIIKLYNLNYPLHTGKVDSLVYRLFLTLIGASLFLLSGLGLIGFTKKLLAKQPINPGEQAGGGYST